MEGLLAVLLAGLAVYAGVRVARYMRMKRYFASDEFLSHKSAVGTVVVEHNEISGYVSEIREFGSFQVGTSATGSHSHLASFQNTSRHRYRRDRNVANYQAPNVHNCSLQVVRNASGEPLKYVMKYFGIKSDEVHLAEVEALGKDIARLENALANIHEREASITGSVSPPKFILKHYANEFMKQVGVVLSPIAIPYPVYVFEYVSAGGNSSQRTTFTLSTQAIDALIEALSQKIRFRRSAAGQRALMTSRLRNSIKDRDNHTCRNCSISIFEEPHLLLEVDHIVPLSKGGLSSEDNLQTLCWKCNRAKSNKMPPGFSPSSGTTQANSASPLASLASNSSQPTANAGMAQAGYGLPSAGWHADPSGNPYLMRYWDGAQWTSHTAPRPPEPGRA